MYEIFYAAKSSRKATKYDAAYGRVNMQWKPG